MAAIHVERIKSAMHKFFHDRIDLSDHDGKPDAQRNAAFLSRALAAYSLIYLADLSPSDAAACVTDGFDDNGIDAVYFDCENSLLYAVQSKWIEDGNGSVAQSDSKKFVSGLRNLVNLRLERFNERVRSHTADLRAAVLDANVRLVFVIAYSGVQDLSGHVRRDMDDLLAEFNDPVELATLETLNQARVYNGIAGYAQRSSINLEIMLQHWGHIEHPFLAYYGQVDATSIAEWWSQHGKALLFRNIRSFKGSTDVNDALAFTLRAVPDHFWYLNNGITIICSSVSKKPLGGPSRESGLFECQGVSIVNGAQTLGIIGSSRGDAQAVRLADAKVLVRLISLDKCPEGFDKIVARATNTQNRIERRDFAALDPNQQRLASEFLLDNRRYAYKSGDVDPPEGEGCSITEATIALACATQDVGLSVQAKREIGRLWDDIEKPPYTLLFNDTTSATAVWRAVTIMRLVEARLQELAKGKSARSAAIAVHGNRLVLHRVFNDSRVRSFRSDATVFDHILSLVPAITSDVFAQLAQHLEENQPNAYLGSLFKNAAKCRDVDTSLVGTPGAQASRKALDDNPPRGNQGMLFDA